MKKTSILFKALAIVGLALALTSLGCAERTHMAINYGRAYRGAFGAQAANPEAGEKARPLPDLDAQEAAIVGKNYHRSLAAKGTPTEEEGILMLAPAKSGSSPYLPPPSVPQSQDRR